MVIAITHAEHDSILSGSLDQRRRGYVNRKTVPSGPYSMATARSPIPNLQNEARGLRNTIVNY